MTNSGTKITDTLQHTAGMSGAAIAAATGLSTVEVYRWLASMEMDGKVKSEPMEMPERSLVDRETLTRMWADLPEAYRRRYRLAHGAIKTPSSHETIGADPPLI